MYARRDTTKNKLSFLCNNYCVEAMNSELRDLKLKNRTMKEKLDSAHRKLTRRNAEIEKLQTHRTKMSQVLTKHEVAMASKMVELVNMNNLLQAAKDQVLELQQGKYVE